MPNEAKPGRQGQDKKEIADNDLGRYCLYSSMDRRAAKSSSSFFNSSRLCLKSAMDSSTSCSRSIRSFLKPPISSSMTAFSVISEALLDVYYATFFL